MREGLRGVVLSAWPIVRREFVGLLRTRKAFWIAVLTVGAASLFPLLSWPEPGNPMAAQTAREAFGDYVRALAAAFFICIPAVAAVSITSERERNTYDLLYGTKIRPSGIILGKLIASTGFFLLLFALTFPMATVLYLLGGFSAGDFALLAGAGVLAIVLIGIVGLWCSIRSRSSISALVRAYLSMVGICILSGVIAGFLTVGSIHLSMIPFFVVFCAASLSISVAVFFSTLRRARFASPPSPATDWQGFATARLRRVPVPPQRSWLARLVLRPAREGIPDGWNPVFAAATMSSARGSFLQLYPFFFALFLLTALSMSFVLFLPLLMMIFRESDLSLRFIVNIPLALTTLILPGAAAASLASERETGSLDFLRCTLLTPRQILAGKLGATLVRAGSLLVPCWLYFVGFILLNTTDASGILATITFLAAAVATSLLAATCGLAGAVLARATLTGTLHGYLLLAACFWAIPGFTETLPFMTSLVVTLALSTLLFAVTTIIFRIRWLRDR